MKPPLYDHDDLLQSLVVGLCFGFIAGIGAALLAVAASLGLL